MPSSSSSFPVVSYHPPPIDAALDAQVTFDIVRYRLRRAVFAMLSLVIIVSELGLGIALLLTHSQEPYGAQAVVLSSVSTLVLTLDVSLGIRERASAHHATLNTLVGIRNQVRHPNASPLWQDYATARAFTKINYVEAMMDYCSWRETGVPPEPHPVRRRGGAGDPGGAGRPLHPGGAGRPLHPGGAAA